MAKAKSAERLLVEDYCKQYEHWADYTLAVKIYEENKDKFKSSEHVRKSYILQIRGKSGEARRKNATHPKPLTHDTKNWKPFKEEVNTSAKILVVDIETAPIKAFVWGIWKQNVGLNQIESDWFCLTWAAKWLFEDKVYSGKLTPKEAKRQDDKRIMKGLWELMNEADIVIAHNGIDFDIPKMNTRFLIHGFPPPLPYQVIDTLKHIKRQFSATSNKLDWINNMLSLTRKIDTGGFELWASCYDGDSESLDRMEEYNIGDVRILEETYLRIRAWIKPHPSCGLHILDETQERCPTCGHNDLQDQGKHYYTSVNLYELLRCNNCGSVSRKRKSVLSADQRKNLLVSTAK